MTTAFTIDGSNWHYNEKMSELVLAVSERSKALDGTEWSWDGAGTWTNAASEYSDVTTGADCQHPYFFYGSSGSDGVQRWIIENCRYFLPDVSPYPAGDYDGESSIQTIGDLAVVDGYATDLNDESGIFKWFCEKVVGGNLYRSATDWGFRRSTNGTSFVNNSGDTGYHRPEDYITGAQSLGHWLWEDMIACLNHLRITLLRSSNSNYYTDTLAPKTNAGEYRFAQTSLANPFTDAQNEYDAYGPDTSSDYPFASTRDDTEDYIVEGASCVIDYYVGDGTLVNDILLYYKSTAQTGGWDDFSNSLNEDLYANIASLNPLSTTSGQLVATDGADLVYNSTTSPYGFKRYNGTEDLKGIILWDFTNGTAW